MKRNDLALFAGLVLLLLVAAWSIGELRRMRQRDIVVYDPVALQRWEVLRQATEITREAVEQ